MAEIDMKTLVIQIDGHKYRMIGSRLEDICSELGITEDRFIDLLARDAYCPTLSAAPTTSTLTYIDTDGSTNHFREGQLCRWEDGGDYRLAICKDISETSSAWYILPAEFLSAEVLERKQDKALKFTNVQATEWVADSTYSDFQYRCDVACQGATPDSYADVAFSLSQATSGIYAPVCDTGENIVSIWSSSNEAIIIPTILITL